MEEALRARRSVRRYGHAPLTLDEVSQLLWAAQGVTSRDGGRTAPSAGARYPLALYLVARDVSGLPAGIYQYRPARHDIVSLDSRRQRSLADAVPTQRWVAEAPAVLVIAAVYERATARYGERGVRYVHMEVGHAAQNVYLQAAALGIGTVFVGAFREDAVSAALGLPQTTQPLGLMPLGRAP